MTVSWSGNPLPGVPDWKPVQALDGNGPCCSCGRVTWLRADPIAGQPSCRGCWESMMFGDES